MPKKARPVTLSDDELRSLTALTGRGSTPARVRARARVLLLLHRGLTHDEVVEALDVAITTVYNIKRRYLSGGLTAALYDKPHTGRPACISEEARAGIAALARSAAPEGHARWTLKLLAAKAVELGLVESVSRGTVRAVLKEAASGRTSRRD
jgi:putative transposase